MEPQYVKACRQFHSSEAASDPKWILRRPAAGFHLSQNVPVGGHVPAIGDLVGQVFSPNSLLPPFFRHTHVFAFDTCRTFCPSEFEADSFPIAADKHTIEKREA